MKNVQKVKNLKNAILLSNNKNVKRRFLHVCFA